MALKCAHWAVVSSISALLVACGGSSSSINTTPTPTSTLTPTPTPTSTLTPTPTPTSTPSQGDVSISGTLTYDFVPHMSNGGLSYNSTTAEPIRGVVVQLLNAQGAVVGSAVSDEQGAYQFSVNANTAYRIRVLAQLSSTESPSWDVRVTDNTSGNALYAMDGELVSSGSSNSTRDLNASSGWTGSSYTAERVAAPFAILDSVYQVVDNLRDGGFSQNFPATELRWSTNNRASPGNRNQGDIGTSFFDPNLGVMYILGDANSDTDEYDRSVVQHEFGHYLEDTLSRSENIGGSHSPLNMLDPRVAFGEGFANAITAAVSGSGIYEDSSGTRQSLGFTFSLENQIGSDPGWYSEGSVGNIVYDIIDDTAEVGDDIDLTFTDVMNTLSSSDYRNSSSLTTIYLFLDELKASTNTAENNAIDALARAHSIFGIGPFGEGETNSGGSSITLPVYRSSDIGTTVELCSRGDADNFNNKVEVRRFLRFTVTSTSDYVISAIKTQGTGDKDPDMMLFRNGERIRNFESQTVNMEAGTINLTPGDYVLEVYDYKNVDPNAVHGASCFDVLVRED